MLSWRFLYQLFSLLQKSPSVQLERGIYLEETKGDLDAAINVYQKILEQAEPERSTAAQAKYRLGMCFLKKGKTGEATKAFEDLIAKYPDEKDLVEKARDQLPPTAIDEEGWSKIGQEAIAKGDLILACDAEMARVMIRKKEGHQYKDKISLDSVYEEYVRGKNPSKEQKEGKLKEAIAYLEKNKGDSEYEWRICHLLSAIAKDLGRTQEAGKYLDQALAAYPEVNYADPSKFSKFHHLVNQRAGMIWDTHGPEAAEKYFLQRLKSDKKCEYFFSPWWKKKYTETKKEDRYISLLKIVRAAYQERLKNFPEKKNQIDTYLVWIEKEIKSLEGK